MKYTDLINGNPFRFKGEMMKYKIDRSPDIFQSDYFAVYFLGKGYYTRFGSMRIKGQTYCELQAVIFGKEFKRSFHINELIQAEE